MEEIKEVMETINKIVFNKRNALYFKDVFNSVIRCYGAITISDISESSLLPIQVRYGKFIRHGWTEPICDINKMFKIEADYKNYEFVFTLSLPDPKEL